MSKKVDWDSIELSDTAIDSVILLSSAPDEQKRSDSEDETAQEDNLNKELHLNNISEFLDWYADLEDEPDDASDLQCRRIISSLRSERNKWQTMQEHVGVTLRSLQELRSLYNDVSCKTNALHNDCEHLLDKQDQLLKQAEQIDQYLAYFNHYETISAKLSSPYLQVTVEQLLPIMNEIDNCLEFVVCHPEFKESQSYEVKFKQLLARCLTLIHDSVFSVLENAVFSLESQIEQLAPETAFTMFYGRFRSHSGKIRPLMELLEERLHKSDDYRNALNECITAYTQQRRRLLQPSVAAAVADMAARFHSDHCNLVRTACSFILHLCEDEESLFKHFFHQLSPLLTEMLTDLCSVLYDALRPSVVHIQHLETLTELCHILQQEAIGSYTVRDTEPQAGAAFIFTCTSVLADVQERLVYRTHVYARAEILGFKPAAGDVAYPDKLEMMLGIAESLKQQQQQHQQQQQQPAEGGEGGGGGDSVNAKNSSSSSSAMPMSPADLHGMWYPTVRRTLTLLSKLSRCLDRDTFQGLSQEILSMCIDSLLSAAKLIESRNRSSSSSSSSISSSIDSDLFLMKHLLILREQVSPFHLEACSGMVREASLDFSKMRSAAASLLTARTRLLALNRNNAFLQFLMDSHPDVIESTLDSRQQVDNELRATCQRFIAAGSQLLTATVAEFNHKCHSLELAASDAAAAGAAAAAAGVQLSAQPFAAPAKVHDLLAEAYRLLKSRVPKLLHSLRLYLANHDTEHILFKPIKASVLTAYKQTESLLRRHYSEEDQIIIAAPSVEQVNLLLNPSRDD